MTSQNDRQDANLTGQVRDQASIVCWPAVILSPEIRAKIEIQEQFSVHLTSHTSLLYPIMLRDLFHQSAF